MQSGGLRSALYFNEVLIDENLVLRWEPIPLTTAMIASEMRSCLSPACDDTGQTNTIVASREGFGPGARYVLSLPGAHGGSETTS